MKAYVTSIGEKTTEMCCRQLEKYGFEVVLFNREEKWITKYIRFLGVANENCIRVDADIVVNENIKKCGKEDCFITPTLELLGAQYCVYDFYKNNVKVGQPVFYTKEAISIINRNLKTLDRSRPEASAWRIPEIDKRILTSDLVVGMHGFFQDNDAMNRAKQNKINRSQIKDYDFDLALELIDLCRKED